MTASPGSAVFGQFTALEYDSGIFFEFEVRIARAGNEVRTSHSAHQLPAWKALGYCRATSLSVQQYQVDDVKISLPSLRNGLIALAIIVCSLGSSGAVTAHADYYRHHRHSYHRHYYYDRHHHRGYYRYY